ncbi:MAG: hypothetical protein VB050_06700 [Geobacteraceae bacterium]|nr:hypothetical protein [Geobacteraceae bacterium]
MKLHIGRHIVSKAIFRPHSPLRNPDFETDHLIITTITRHCAFKPYMGTLGTNLGRVSLTGPENNGTFTLFGLQGAKVTRIHPD